MVRKAVLETFSHELSRIFDCALAVLSRRGLLYHLISLVEYRLDDGVVLPLFSVADNCAVQRDGPFSLFNFIFNTEIATHTIYACATESLSNTHSSLLVQRRGLCLINLDSVVGSSPRVLCPYPSYSSATINLLSECFIGFPDVPPSLSGTSVLTSSVISLALLDSISRFVLSHSSISGDI